MRRTLGTLRSQMHWHIPSSEVAHLATRLLAPTGPAAQLASELKGNERCTERMTSNATQPRRFHDKHHDSICARSLTIGRGSNEKR